jgi:hypothetical protein
LPSPLLQQIHTLAYSYLYVLALDPDLLLKLVRRFTPDEFAAQFVKAGVGVDADHFDAGDFGEIFEVSDGKRLAEAGSALRLHRSTQRQRPLRQACFISNTIRRGSVRFLFLSFL